MPSVPRALAGLRDRVFGRRAPGTNARTATVRTVLPDSADCPSPEMWGAILAGARRRRAAHLWPAAVPSVWEPQTSALVRAYVLPPQERARVFVAPAGEAQWR
ncbi:hypothetical protein SSP24_42360 [Streptomyces spinoverrucosus]|uniref:Uncharacterized protein n=1 Tax=Streptomyces spinoverrucosus TaxID=284043 RepID=A0A4Y3VLH6_9ACTN|nr:hypothetical protein [Streptomyces spinoverrucosus]GEC06581.1 hypothetical protein SSP24_42360 [Streptomyces spinoverrucosus]GHB54169.1 hypothetical protein GCM10010397_25480 [Streptomyces spinoverrucosus]